MITSESEANMIDRLPRYAPDKVRVSNSLGTFILPVLQYVVHPPNNHPPHCPIKHEMTVLELRTNGGSRWYGCDRAYINSELRMIVIGFDSRDEVRSKWEIAEIECTCPGEILPIRANCPIHGDR